MKAKMKLIKKVEWVEKDIEFHTGNIFASILFVGLSFGALIYLFVISSTLIRAIIILFFMSIFILLVEDFLITHERKVWYEEETQ